MYVGINLYSVIFQKVRQLRISSKVKSTGGIIFLIRVRKQAELNSRQPGVEAELADS